MADWRSALSAAVTDGVALVQLTSVHTLPFSLAQNCTAHHLSLPSVAVAWDAPSLTALRQHNVSAILVDVFEVVVKATPCPRDRGAQGCR